MEKEIFLGKVYEAPKSAERFLAQDMAEDMLYFTDDAQEGIRRLSEGSSVKRSQWDEFEKERDDWWFEKYGFPFDNKLAREELLRKKYDSESRTSDFLMAELLKAIQSDSETRIAQIRQRYIEEFPDQLEGAEALFALREYLLAAAAAEENQHMTFRERTKYIRNLTEYQFLFTHFLLQNKEDREFLVNFWQAGAVIAEKAGQRELFEKLRHGQLGQISVSWILQELGKHPKLSHPKEDAFNAIDLWSEEDTAVQVKTLRTDQPAIIETDHAVFPSMLEDNKKSGSMYYPVQRLEESNKIFKAKIEEYGKRIGKQLKGYMVVVPSSKIDPVNGKPSPEMLEFFRKNMK